MEGKRGREREEGKERKGEKRESERKKYDKAQEKEGKAQERRRKRAARPGAREKSAREKSAREKHNQMQEREAQESRQNTRGGGANQTRAADRAEKAQDRQPGALQTPYIPSRPILDRSLKEAIEGEVLSF